MLRPSKPIRVLLALLAAAFATLWFGSALADSSQTQELIVTPFDTTPGHLADTYLELVAPQSGAATAEVTIGVPKGYQLNSALGAGQKLGDAAGTFTTGGVPVNAQTGTLVSADPNALASDPLVQACAPGPHNAAWLATIEFGSVTGHPTVTIPILVDVAPPSDTTDSFLLHVCFQSPQMTNNAPNTTLRDAQFEYLALDTTAMFTSPSTPGVQEWHAYFTDYTSDGTAADPTSTVEVRCKVPLPQQIVGLKVSYAKTPKHFPKVIITGRLLAAGAPRTGIDVRVDTGTTFNGTKPWAGAITDVNGRFRIEKPLKRNLFAFFYTDVYYSFSCSPTPSTAPKGCLREDTAPEFGPIIVLHPRR